MKTTTEFESSYALLVVDLEQGESIKAEPGAMVSQLNVEISTGISGKKGIMGGFRNIMGGESFFINTFTGGPMGGQVSLAPGTPGDIGCFNVEPGRDLFIQSGSFLACTENVQTDSSFQGFKGMFSGESLFFIRAFTEDNPGRVYYNSYGAIREMMVKHGEELVVDTGHLVAFTEEVDYSIGKIGGIRSMIAGGEGLVMKFKGNGHVWIQTRNIQSLVDKIAPFLPSRK